MLLEDTLTKLLLKNLEVESFKNKKYEEIEKNKNVYIFSCDKSNIYKIGKSKDVEQRKKQLQTANVDTIIIHHTRPTSDDYLLELIVHSILDQYRCKSNGEHFTANLDYMKMVIDMAEIFFDTLKSTYEYITKEELLLKINDNILNQKTISQNNNQIIDSSGESLNKIIKKVNKKIINKQNINLNVEQENPIINLEINEPINNQNINLNVEQENPIINLETNELINNQNINLNVELENSIINLVPTKEIVENNPIKLFLDSHFIITKNNKDNILCSEFTKIVNTYNSDKMSAIKIVKDMAFNGFQQHKIKGLRYYCGLIIKSKK